MPIPFSKIGWNYEDCTCVTDNATISLNNFGSARKGRCASDDACKHWQLYPFLVLFALVILPMLFLTAPAMQATLRCVPTRLTSVAIGLQVSHEKPLNVCSLPGKTKRAIFTNAHSKLEASSFFFTN